MSYTKGYYQSLITHQYQNSPKFMNFLGAFLDKLVDISTIADELNTDFYIDTCVGAQLDILGEIIGVSRTLPFTPVLTSTPTLTDTIYRTLLKATIGKNQWDGKQDSLQTLWTSIFTDATIAIHDNHAMNMDVFIGFPDDATEIFEEIIPYGFVVPRPEGVRCKYYIIPPNPIFGFDFADPYVNGLDMGYFREENPNTEYPAFGFDADTALISGFDEGYWWY